MKIRRNRISAAVNFGVLLSLVLTMTWTASAQTDPFFAARHSAIGPVSPGTNPGLRQSIFAGAHVASSVGTMTTGFPFSFLTFFAGSATTSATIVDPQAFAGNYILYNTDTNSNLGTFSGTQSLNLVAGNYLFDNYNQVGGSYFSFSVNEFGQVTNVSNPNAAQALGNTLRLNNATITIEPGGYTGRYSFPAANNLHTGQQSFVVVPGLRYGVDNGTSRGSATAQSYFYFDVGPGGAVTNIDVPPAAYGIGNTLHFNNQILNVDPNGYAGTYNISSYHTITPQVTGPHSFVLIPGMLYAFDKGTGTFESTFKLGAGGTPTDIQPVSLGTGVGNTLVLTGAPPPPVTAPSIQRWSITNGFYALNVFGDGTILAASDNFVSGPGSGVKLNPSDGSTIAPFSPPDVRTSIRLSTGDQDYVVGGYENRSEVREDNSFVRYLLPLGCCNIPRYPMALDATRDVGYVQANGALFVTELSTGNWDYMYGAIDTFGMISIADPETLYLAGQQGDITRMHPDTGHQWHVNLGRNNFQPGAVAADGSIVVSSGLPHFQGSPETGILARVAPDGMVSWNHDVNAVTPPVIGSNGLVFVGTQAAPINVSGAGAIKAYNVITGALVWSTAVQGLPNDLLVGDDGAVYAGTGSFSNGRVYALGQSDGAIRQTITDVPGAWEIILRAGLLYASGQSITALPVAAVNYDLNSPWPVRFHDNQRTSNRQTPILTPARIGPFDTTAPTTTITANPSANLAGWNNSDVSLSLSSSDNAGGAGVSTVAYSATGAQPTPLTVVNGATTSLTITAEGQTTITYFATDNAGNVEATQTMTIRIDKTPPSVMCGQADGSWHASDVSIGCTSSDGGSGLVNSADASFALLTNVSNGTETASAATNSRMVCDIAGNCSTAGPIDENKIDKKAPTIVITMPTSGAVYLLNQVVTASYSCTDGGSGVAACAGPISSGSAIDTASAGGRIFTVNAADNAGNQASPESLNYAVGYAINPLFDQTKAHKSGSTVPIKLQLVDADGRNVSSAGVTVHAVALIQVATRASETINDAGNANPDGNFRFEGGSGGSYVFNLKTTGLSAGTYRLEFVAGADPAVHAVLFQVRQ